MSAPTDGHMLKPASVAVMMMTGVLTACSSESSRAVSVEPVDGYTEFRNYVRSCWYLDASTHTEKDFVTVIMHMNPDKTLKSFEIDPADREKMSDPAYRLFAESVLRAVERCSMNGKQFPIGDDRPYSEWNEITARFRGA